MNQKTAFLYITIFYRRDIVFPGDVFPGTYEWDKNNQHKSEDHDGESKPGVMTRW